MNPYVIGALIAIGITAGRPIVHGAKKAEQKIVCVASIGKVCKAKSAKPAKPVASLAK